MSLHAKVAVLVASIATWTLSSTPSPERHPLAPLDVRLILADGQEAGSWRLPLAVDGQQRLSREIRGGGERREVVIDVAVRAVEESSAEVTVHARITGEGGVVTWVSRELSLQRGTWQLVDAPKEVMRVAFGFAAGPFDASLLTGDVVAMTTTILLRELTSDGPRTLSRRRVRLRGPAPVEVVLAAGEGTGESRELRLQLTPRSRSDEGAVLALGVEVAGVDAIRHETLRLDWDDEVRISGFQGTCGKLVVDIKPER